MKYTFAHFDHCFSQRGLRKQKKRQDFWFVPVVFSELMLFQRT